MLDWLIDQSNFFYFLLGAAAVVLLAQGWRTSRVVYWAYAAGCVGVIFLIWLLGLFIISDRKQIVLDLDAMAQATQSQNADALFKHISKEFRYGNTNRDELHKLVSAAIGRHKIKDIRLWDQQVKRTKEGADATFNFRAEREGGGFFAASGSAKFVKEDGRWKMSSLQINKLGTTERQFVPGID